MRQALKELPKTLDETYERILCSIHEQHSEQVYSILQWLAFSERPLLLEEAAEAAIMKSGSCSLDLDDRLFKSEGVLQLCSSLVTVTYVFVDDYGDVDDYGNEYEDDVDKCKDEYGDDDKSEFVPVEGKRQRKQVRFAHFSVKEYIVSERLRNSHASKFWVSGITSHINISNFCLSYLLLLGQYDSLSEDILAGYPLHEYSARYWYTHVKIIENDALNTTETMSLLLRLLDPSEEFAFINWLRIYDPDVYFGEKNLGKEFYQVASPLYYAALVGLLEATKILLQNQAEVNAQGGEFGNALQAASLNGHEGIGRLLIEKGGGYQRAGSGVWQFAGGVTQWSWRHC